MNYKNIYPLLDLDYVECPDVVIENDERICKNTGKKCVLYKFDYCETMCDYFINEAISNNCLIRKIIEMYNDSIEKLDDIHNEMKGIDNPRRSIDYDIEIYRAASRKNTLRELLVYYFKHNL